MKRSFKNSILFQPIKVESYSNLFSSLAKTILYTSKRDFDEALLSLMDTGTALGIEETEARLGWKLINRSVIRAIADLIEENKNNFPEIDEETFVKNIKKLSYDKEFKVDNTFFNNPKDSEFVKDIQSVLLNWFKEAGIEEHKSETIILRFPSFFVYALNDEWAKNSKEYERLLVSTETPFSEQAIMEDDWEKYRTYLDKQTQESIFDEVFSLSQIYIPLCAYYKDEKGPVIKNKVINLYDTIYEWLGKEDKDDSVRIISGGPGSGKSSFAKMLAANIINKNKILFIPLHHLNLNNDIEEDISKFLISNKFFEKTPIGKENKLLIIFDGLDELSMQGKIGAEAAHDFIHQVEYLLGNFNNQRLQLNIIITGRDLPVNEIEIDFKKNGQVIHVLPYYVNKETYKEYDDEKMLLSEDKRNLWWKEYGKLTGKNYKEFPKELNKDILIEITAQPLLNYLLALSYDRKKIQFSDNTNRNDIYRDLIDAVYERGWQGKHRAIKHIEKSNFELVLEEIAVSMWQGTGRTTTLENIKKRCEKSKVVNVLSELQENAEKGVLNLLTAFYFRQSGKTSEGDKTFEFTHKSFGEYLTALKIVRQLQRTKKALEAQKIDGTGWTQEDALTNWIELCSNVPLNSDIHKFLCDEMLRFECSEVESWQDMLCELISYMLKFGMPFEKISPRPTYYEETRQSRNAEEALLATLSACSRFTNKISNIEWKEDTSAGEWLSRLCGQPKWSFVFAYSCLNNINFSKCIFILKNFFEANLSEVNLKGADLREADLSKANFRRADLSESNLRGVNLSEAHMSDAHLNEVDLRGADLKGANLREANLREANLRGISLSGVYLNKADLRGADLRGADLRGVHLSRANLSKADLRKADLNGAYLEGAILKKANLSNTYHLFQAKLDCAIFQKGDLSEADEQKAIALGAIIEE